MSYEMELKESILEGMRSLVEDMDEPCYPLERVDQCGRILDAYLPALRDARGQQAILAEVRKTVLALNVLNDECNGALIETEQREELCDLIQHAACEAGLETGDDVTEQWREW